MKNLLYLLLIVVWAAACSTEQEPSKDKLREEITALEQTLLQQTDNPTIDTASAVTLIGKVESYASRFPQDSMTPHLLFRNADVARGIGQPQQAIDMYSQVVREYRDFPKLAEAMFFRAFTADNNLEDKDLADQYYRAFIRAYPDHRMTKDAKLLLEVLNSGKTPNELIREFQEKQKNEGE